MKSTLAALLLLGLAAGCGGKDAAPSATALTPELVRGVWTFTRTGPSSCVPETLNVRLTTAFYSIGVANQLSVSGDWTSNRDARVRVFTGDVTTSGAFVLKLTLNEGVRGTMDADGNATASAYCSDGSTATLTGVRKT